MELNVMCIEFASLPKTYLSPKMFVKTFDVKINEN